MKKQIYLFIGLIAIISFASCNGTKSKKIKNPIDSLVTMLSAEQNFSIILTDMDYVEKTRDYKHKYKMLISKQIKRDSVVSQDTLVARDTIIEKLSNWMLVDKKMFEQMSEAQGMEVASKVDGKVKKVISPAGYSQFVGNNEYGRWHGNGNNSFWAFYGKYAMMSTMFHMAMFPIRRSYYNNYRTSYMGNRAYYGPSTGGKNMYGTSSAYNGKASGGSTWSGKSSSFKQRFKNKSKTTRTNTRYNNTKVRSRSGGSGK